VTPEPSSLLFLGTGLLSAAGMLIRKRSLLA
jgi:PEP-CTERM motif